MFVWAAARQSVPTLAAGCHVEIILRKTEYGGTVTVYNLYVVCEECEVW